MSLRIFLALVFFLPWAVAAPGPMPDLSPPTVGLLLHFDRQPSDLFVKQLQREIDAMFRPAGFQLRWETPKPGKPIGTYDRVIIVEMRGFCGTENWYGDPIAPGTPLGWTIVNDGEILPHVIVDCDRIRQAHATMRLRFNSTSLREIGRVRLAARTLAHEMVHVLLDTVDHKGSDFNRPSLRSDDLLFAPRFTRAEISVLQRIGRGAGGVSLARTGR